MRHLPLLAAVLTTIAAVGVCLPASASAAVVTQTTTVTTTVPEPRERLPKPLIQIAILLDDSGSMDGLINQARAHLWSVVNKLGATTRNGLRPQIQVALYHYGDQPFLAAPLLPFSSDLDLVSQRLFSIHGGGGSEHCGEVIRNALHQLSWSNDPEAMKVIVIAGNEPFTQGPVDYRSACREAIGRGIAINTVHCGDRSTGIATNWEDGARLAEGTYTTIDQDRTVADLPCPQDADLARLNQELNRTYVAYGAAGAAAQSNQVAQDRLVLAAAPSAAAERTAAKASAVYTNSSWDLVDARKDGKLAEVKEEDLPAEFKGKDAAERDALIATKQAERERIQQDIARVAQERSEFLAKAKAEAGTAPGTGLDEALGKALQEQAAKRGFVSP